MGIEDKISRRSVLKGLGAAGLTALVAPHKLLAGGTEEVKEAKDRCERQNDNYNDCIYISDLYESSTPVKNANFPEGTRKVPFYGEALNGNHTAILPEATRWKENGQFSQEVFNSKYSEDLQRVLQEYGVNVDKLRNLTQSIEVEDSVAIYNNGYMLLADSKEDINYIFPIKPDIKSSIYAAYK